MTLSRGDYPWFLAFCPNGAQGDSPGQRPVGSNVAIEPRPEGAELNGEDIHSPTYPGRRFALPWDISFCPFGAGKQKTPTARGLSPSFLPSHFAPLRRGNKKPPPRGDCPRVSCHPVLAAVRTGIPEGSKPLAGGKRSATSGGNVARSAKGAYTTGQSPPNHLILRSNRPPATEKSEQSATLSRGDCPRFLVKRAVCPRFLVEHDVHLCCLIAMGSVCGQFRFAGRFDPIEPKSFGLIRKFRCGMSIQVAYFQARDFDRNRVAIVQV